MSGSDLRQTTGLDRLIHEPARMVIVTMLASVEQVDFLFLLKNSGLTKGNLSAHLARLETAGYVEIEKTYKGKLPQTLISLTDAGRTAFDKYRKQLKAFVDQLPE